MKSLAGGMYTVRDDAEFAAPHALLREHDVSIIMAGDTHDLEYYGERPDGSLQTAHHFVNGGGGAYLSFGTALDWPARPATAEWALYPNRDQVVAKVQATTPIWKRPAWWWTKRIGAWPFSAEWLSAAFDANVAPFYQSFIEVRVDSSKKRIRLIPYGVNGRLRWEDLEASRGVRPGGRAGGMGGGDAVRVIVVDLARLAKWAQISRSSEQPGDLGLNNRSRARPAG